MMSLSSLSEFISSISMRQFLYIQIFAGTVHDLGHCHTLIIGINKITTKQQYSIGQKQASIMKQKTQLTKKRKAPPVSSSFIDLLKSELQEAAQQQPCELFHLLSPQVIQPSGILLQPAISEKDTMINHANFLQDTPPAELELLAKYSGTCHLPYCKRIILESVPYKTFEERLTRKFVVDDRLLTRPTLERVGLVKSLENYEKNMAIPIGDKSFHKYLSVDILTLLHTYTDTFIEYGSTTQPEQAERTCVFHVLNHVLKREKIVSEDEDVFRELEGIEGKKGLDLKDFIEEGESGLEEEDKSEPEKEENEAPKKVEEESFDMTTKWTASANFKNHITSLVTAPNEDSKYELIKDQGFTKAKVLILCPFKAQAFEVVSELVTQFKHKWKGIAKKKKFKEEYGSPEEASNDCFRLGIAFYGKTMKLYAPFKKADIIIASPVGLKTIVQEAEGDTAMKYDFLSSIEIVLLTSAHLFMYQNVDHVEEVLKNLNELPTKTDGLTNINRIMNVFLDKKGKQLKQTIILTKHASLELNYLFKACGTNYMGRVTIPYDYPCCLSKDLIAQKKKVYLRKIPVGDIESAHEKKCDYFIKKVWPKLYETLKTYTIFYVPSYFDFVRLKKHFKDMQTSMGYISEYTSKKVCQRERALYETKRIRFLMFTERTHFFELIKLRFARHVVFYGIPQDPSFVREMLELINPEKEAAIEKIAETQKSMLKEEGQVEIGEEEEDNKWDAYIYYTKHDEYELQRIVGTGHVKRYLTTETNIKLTQLSNYYSSLLFSAIYTHTFLHKLQNNFLFHASQMETTIFSNANTEISQLTKNMGSLRLEHVIQLPTTSCPYCDTPLCCFGNFVRCQNRQCFELKLEDTSLDNLEFAINLLCTAIKTHMVQCKGKAKAWAGGECLFIECEECGHKRHVDIQRLSHYFEQQFGNMEQSNKKCANNMCHRYINYYYYLSNNMLKLWTLHKLVRTIVSLPIRTMAFVPGSTEPKGLAECARTVKFLTSYNGLPFIPLLELDKVVNYSLTIERIADGFQNFSDIICHSHIGAAFTKIAAEKMELTEDFWEIVYPYARALVAEANRETTAAMIDVLISLSTLLVQDEELWEVAQKKLVKDGMLRYVQIQALPELFYAFVYNKKGTPETLEAIEKVILRNMKFYWESTYTPLAEQFKNAYDLLEKRPPEAIQEFIDKRYHPPMPYPNFQAVNLM
eukprot:TRINITY_DN64322_c1_g1_i1.p1 TRINITY_DN64322_c1_g1~~TRINITY_DN64322_c1_g1_i1.p1  ORF type:complete len:1202 (-),score=108.17 TRINITY_DN64322_c1_g1_i1:4294-7899(-)